MRGELWRWLIEVGAWGLAAAWCVRVSDLLGNMPGLPDLSQLEWDLTPEKMPSLVVVVPARDEAEHIAATMDALVAVDYARLQVVAIDDRSTDATGEILDGYAARYPERITVIHVAELADGWLGKTFAMQLAVEQTESDYLLFTDADVLFSPSILRRALAYAEMEKADHLVVMPTMQVKGKGEGIVLGFFQILGMWASRPWRVSDPEAKRDVIGVGAFNMLRRDALVAMGGLELQRLAVLEDITLGRRVKAAGLRQRVAFAKGLVLVHWAKGAGGLVRVMTKNIFSGVNFRPVLLLGVCAWVVVFCLLPLAGLWWWPTVLPAVVVMGCVAASYRTFGVLSGIDARYGWLYPMGVVIFIYAMLRSMVFAFLIGGVRWRGTHYPLQELRRHNSPFYWERAERAKRAQERTQQQKP